MIVNNVKVPIGYTEQQLYKAVKKASNNPKLTVKHVEILKRSIDARKKPQLFYVMSVAVNEKECDKKLTELRVSEPHHTVVVGAGPAGLFAAMTLLEAGMNVTLIERGKCVEERTEDVENFWNGGPLLKDSNVQFGEGGAGTFSDGKLNTAAKDVNDLHARVMHEFYRSGANKEVLYDTRAHVGTDRLREVVKAFRNKILSLGGTILFSTKLVDLIIEDGCTVGVKVQNTSEILEIHCDDVVLATGHSARDTYEMLLAKGISMEQKAFAVGLRMEHPQEMITLSQYGTLDYEELGAAPYKVTAKTSENRGVYSFCMCPGGYVVNASSEPERLAINGMSYSGRDSENANSGIVIQIFPEDFPEEGPLSGLAFQEMLEEKAYRLLNGKIPVQTYGDFVNDRLTENFGEVRPSMKGAYGFASLRGLFPESAEKALLEAIPAFGRMIKGFDRPDALLSAVESRTSSPVRIPRDESGQSNIKNLYPCGEGAGYAGGIVSSAKDGIRTAELIIKKYPEE